MPDSNQNDLAAETADPGKTAKQGLSSGAYGGIHGDDYRPYISPDRIMPEFTLRAVILGCILGVLFGAANAAVGLRVGLTISASIPISVMAVALFGMLKKMGAQKGSILENNIIQTIGSAGEAIAGGVIFTIPAFFLTSFLAPGVFDITILQIFVTAVLGGILGVFCMIPLRRYLIKKEHGKLPYPEGTACAEVLVAGDTGGTNAKQVFLGLGVGGLYTALLRGARLWKGEAVTMIPGFKNAQLSLDVSPALLGVGYILDYQISAIMVGGAMISWLGLIPLISLIGEHLPGIIYPGNVPIGEMTPDDIWSNYIRYIGAGAVAFGGIITLIRAIPTIIESFKLGAAEMIKSMKGKLGIIKRTERDIPLPYVAIGYIVVIILLAWVPQLPVGIVGGLLMAVFAFFFGTVSSRITGLIGSSSNPISGMTIATLIGTSFTFVLLGWTGPLAKVAALSVGAVVCISASIAGDTSQDLKTGFLVGATPFYQQIGLMIGVLFSSIFIGYTVVLLHKTYTIGSPDLAAPQATIMSFVIDGIIGGSLPWDLIFIGVAFGIIMEILGLPSLPLAVGIYLPIASMATVFVGGCLRRIIEKRSKSEDLRVQNRERGILFASGLIAGEGLIMVFIAIILLYLQMKPKDAGIGYDYMGSWANLGSLAIFGLLALSLYKFSYRGKSL